MNSIKVGKKEVKLPLFTDDMAIYIDNKKKSVKYYK